MIHSRSVADCLVCEYIVRELESIAKNNKTDEAIIEAWEKICAIVPQTFQAQCKDYITTYGPYIFQLIVDMGDPRKVCQLVKICA
jgi:saposin